MTRKSILSQKSILFFLTAILISYCVIASQAQAATADETAASQMVQDLIASGTDPVSAMEQALAQYPDAIEAIVTAALLASPVDQAARIISAAKTMVGPDGQREVTAAILSAGLDPNSFGESGGPGSGTTTGTTGNRGGTRAGGGGGASSS